MVLPLPAGLAGGSPFEIRVRSPRPGPPSSGDRPGEGDSVRRPVCSEASIAPSASSSEPAEARAPELIAACARGEPAAREEFVRQYEGLVRYAIYVVLRQRSVVLPREELEDLQQTVMAAYFERSCRRLQMYEGRNRASFATFVRVCATRQTLDFLRQRRRRPSFAEEGDPGEGRAELLETADPTSGPEEAAATRQHLARLREVVESLPPREQILVRLHFVEGLDVPAVARVLGISENAAHVLKSRVRAKLRAALDSSAEPDTDG